MISEESKLACWLLGEIHNSVSLQVPRDSIMTPGLLSEYDRELFRKYILPDTPLVMKSRILLLLNFFVVL